MKLTISDGWTLTHTIPARGIFPALTVEYRPALHARVKRWVREAEEARGKKDQDERAAKADVALLADQLVSWSLDAPLDEAHLSRLLSPVINQLCNLVAGYLVPDATELERAEGNSAGP